MDKVSKDKHKAKKNTWLQNNLFLSNISLFLSLYVKSFRLLFSNYAKLFSSIIADFITLFLSIFILTFFARIIENPLTEFLVNIPNPEKPASNALVILITAFLVLYVLLYIIFSLIQPISWRSAHEITLAKCPYKKIFKHFFKANLFFIIILAIINLYHDVFFTINKITGIIVINKMFLDISYNILLFLFSYIAIISYSTLLNFKASLIFAAKNFFKLIMPMILIALTFIIINYTMIFAATLHPWLTYILGIVLFIPAISFARIYLISITKEYV